MVSRDPTESHRASTPLELFFDLTFVVAVAQAGSALQAGQTEGQGPFSSVIPWYFSPSGGRG